MSTSVNELAVFGGPKTISDELAAEMFEAARWPRIAESTIEKCADMLRRGIISLASGGVVEEMETAFARFVGVKHCLLQNNGTSTLHAAYHAVGVQAGDEVIVPSHTWPATVTPIHALGAKPVYCEIDERTLTVDPADIERRITPRTKAICVVHIWGNPCDMDRIMDISRRTGIPVIEDCSHAHGATFKGRRVGSFGAVGCFSMQGSKVLPGGELGAVVTNDDLLFDRIVAWGHQGRVPQTALSDEYRKYEFGFGYKYRPFPLAVQIALDQLAVLEETNRQRWLSVDRFNEALSGIPHIRVVEQYEGTVRTCYAYVFLFDQETAGVSTPTFVEALRAEGVPASTMRYKLVHKQPPVESDVSLPVTERNVARMVMLQPFTIPDEAKVKRYAQKVGEAVRKVVAGLDRLAAAR